MRPYGFDGLRHITDDCDVAGVLNQGGPSKHGVRQDPKDKAESRRHFKRAHRQNVRREIAKEVG